MRQYKPSEIVGLRVAMGCRALVGSTDRPVTEDSAIAGGEQLDAFGVPSADLGRSRIDREYTVTAGDMKPVAITEAEYMDALCILPPERWVSEVYGESFRMCEYLMFNLTNQYGRSGDRYVRKLVDVTDRSTWIKASDFEVYL